LSATITYATQVDTLHQVIQAVRSGAGDRGGRRRDAGRARPADEMGLLQQRLGGLLQNQESIRGQVWLASSALAGVPTVNVENACASGDTARPPCTKPGSRSRPDTARPRLPSVPRSSTCPTATRVRRARHRRRPGRSASPGGRTRADGAPKSMVMDIYAAVARRYAARTAPPHGTTPSSRRQRLAAAVGFTSFAALGPEVGERARQAVRRRTRR
jgi:hypothetical protein